MFERKTTGDRQNSGTTIAASKSKSADPCVVSQELLNKPATTLPWPKRIGMEAATVVILWDKYRMTHPGVFRADRIIYDFSGFHPVPGKLQDDF